MSYFTPLKKSIPTKNQPKHICQGLRSLNILSTRILWRAWNTSQLQHHGLKTKNAPPNVVFQWATTHTIHVWYILFTYSYLSQLPIKNQPNAGKYAIDQVETEGKTPHIEPPVV